MKKFLVLALSLCMVLALCVCGYAEEGNHDLNPAVDHSDECLVTEGFSYITVEGCSAYECGKGAYIHFHCTICGDVVDTLNFDDIIHTEHEYETVYGYDSSCEGVEEPWTGLTDGSQCWHNIGSTWEKDGIAVNWTVYCGAWETEQEVIPVKACEAAQWYHWSEDFIRSYIQENGLFCDAIDSLPAYCKYCWNELEGSVAIELEHEWAEVKAVEPDCYNEGYKAFECCDICGACKLEDKIYYIHWGWTEEFYKAVRVAPKEHKNADGTSAYVNKNGSLGTCTTPAVSDYKECALCGDIQGQKWMDPTGHDYTIHVAAKPATCSEDGWYEYWTCENDGCDAYVLHDIYEWEDSRNHAWCCDGYGVPVQGALNHDGYVRMKPGVAPTCTTEGNAAYQYCTECGTVWYNGAEFASAEDALVTIPAHGHVDEAGYEPLNQWDPWNFTLVKRDAWKHLLVEIDEYYSYSDKLPYADYEAWFKACEAVKWDWDKRVANNLVSYDATCEEAGYQLALYCPWCGEIRVDAHVVPAKVHEYVIIEEGYFADCENEGRSDREQCVKCGNIIGWDVINPRGHVLVDVEGSMADCANDGNYNWAYCTREGCNHAEYYKVNLILRQGDVATGFGVDIISGTYTVDEKTKAIVPSFKDEAVIPAFEHGTVYPYGTPENSPCIAPVARVESTCLETGLYEGGEYCTLCDVYTIDPVVMPKKDHDWCRWESGRDSTCTTEGQFTTSFCYTCGLAYKWHWNAEIEELVLGEAYFEWDTEKVVWEVELPESAIIPAKGHVEAPSKYVAPTCTEVGYEADGIWCTRCGVTVKEATEIPATGHDKEILAYVAPTCTTKGKTEGFKCKVCGYVEAQEEIPALGHEYGLVKPYTAPTCTKDGNKAGLGCSNEGCDSWLVYPTVIPATNHHTYDKETNTYGESYLREVQAQEPLCEMAGWQYFVYCSNPKCDYVAGADDDILDGGMMMIYSVPFDAKGNVVTEKHYFYINGEECYFVTPVIPEALKVAGEGHVFNEYVEKDATCTENGSVTAKTCKVCGYNEPGQFRPALGHNMVYTVVEPTCVENGWKGYACDREGCDYVDEETFEVIYCKGYHEEYHVEAIAPTCTEVGYEAGVKCKNCDEHVIGCGVIPATGHSKGEWVVERQPQLPQNDPVYGGYGLEVLYCANTGCGEPLDQRTIEPLKLGTLGDANNDGAVNAVDALAILLYDARLLPASRIDLALADVNGDGVVNSIDSLLVLKMTI